MYEAAVGVLIVLYVFSFGLVSWVVYPLFFSKRDLTNNESFEAYRKQLMNNIEVDDRSFRQWLREKSRKEDKAAFEEWQKERYDQEMCTTKMMGGQL